MSSNVEPPSNNFFVKYYGADGNQQGVDMEILPDGIMILGNSELLGARRILLVKTDLSGQVLWQKTMSGPSDFAIDLEPTIDNNFVILVRHETSASNHDVQLIKISPDGVKLDSTGYFGSPLIDTPSSVTALSNGDFIVCGGTASGLDPNNADAKFFHYRANADLQFNGFEDFTWNEESDTENRIDFATKAFEFGDGFIVFGHSTRNHEQRSPELIRSNGIYFGLNASGVQTQAAHFGAFNENLTTHAIAKAPDALGGGFMILSSTEKSSGSTSLQITKLRSSLSIQTGADDQFDLSLTQIPRSVTGKSVIAAMAGGEGYLLLSDEIRAIGTKNLLLQKVNLVGALQWSVSFGSEDENDTSGAVKELPDGKILVLGTVELSDNQTKIALFKLNSYGKLQ